MSILGQYKQAKELSRDVQVLWRYDKYEDAISVCQRLVELMPSVANGWEALGFSLLKAQRYEESVAAYDKAYSFDKKGAQHLGIGAHRNRLYALMRLSRLDEALAASDILLAQAPKDSYAWTCRGQIFIEQKRYEDAEEALLTAVDLAPTDQTLWKLTRLYYVYTHEYSKAMEASERLLALKPNDGAVWHLRGFILSQSGMYEQACAAFERALACSTLSDAEKGNLWINFSHVLICLGRFRDALVAVDSGVALAPRNSLLLINRGEVYSHLGREMEALACYEEAHAAQPDALLPQIDIAAALVTLGSLDEAKTRLDAVFAVDTDHGCAWYVAGLRETVLDHFDDALDAFDKSIILEPGHASHYAAFAELLLKLEDPAHACQVIERALAIDAFDARSWRIKAQALRAAGKLEEAAEAERRGAVLLAEQTAQVDAYLQAKQADGGK